MSGASSVDTAMRSYMADDGRFFAFDNQALISSQQAAVVKSRVVNVAERRDMTPAGLVKGGERKRTAAQASRSSYNCPIRSDPATKPVVLPCRGFHLRCFAASSLSAPGARQPRVNDCASHRHPGTADLSRQYVAGLFRRSIGC